MSILFPVEPRGFPFRRMIRTLLRAVHILAGGVLLSAYLFNQDAAVIHTWFMATFASGLLLLATDLHSSFAFILEWRGLSVLSKVALLALVPVLDGWEVFILSTVLMAGAISSHLPGKFRHRVWFKGAAVTVDRRHG